MRRILTWLIAVSAAAVVAAGGSPVRADDLDYDHHYRDDHRAYDHYARDRRADQRHHLRDGLGGFGHGVGDLFRYGSTNSYSSPRHYYRDQRRQYDHAWRDRRRSYDHYERDRWNSYRQDRRDAYYYDYDDHHHGY